MHTAPDPTRMKLTRRSLFGTVVASVVAFTSRKGMAQSGIGFLSKTEFDTLSAFVDTLIPADEQSPAATSLDVPRAVVAVAAKDRQVRRIVRLGCRWLDMVARSAGAASFSSLDDRLREAIAEHSAAREAEPLPKAFFQIVRDLSMRGYYARAAAWGGLEYDGPPQPEGFLGYRDAPRTGNK